MRDYKSKETECGIRYSLYRIQRRIRARSRSLMPFRNQKNTFHKSGLAFIKSGLAFWVHTSRPMRVSSQASALSQRMLASL